MFARERTELKDMTLGKREVTQVTRKINLLEHPWDVFGRVVRLQFFLDLNLIIKQRCGTQLLRCTRTLWKLHTS